MIINAQDNCSRVFGDVNKSIGTVNDSFGGLGGKAFAASKAIGLVTLAAGTMAATFATFAAREAMDFETAIANISTLLWGVQEDDLPAIEEGIMSLTRKVPLAAKDLSAAFYDIQSTLGLGAEGLKVLEVVGKAAVGGSVDAKTAADLMTTVMGAFKLEAEDAAYANDVLFATIKTGKLEYKDLAVGIGDVVGPAYRANQSLEEIGAAIAVITGVTGQKAESFTKVGQAIKKLQLPAIQGKFKNLGIECLDAAGKIRPLHEIIVEMADKDLTYAQIFDAVPLERAAQGFDLLIQNSDTLIKHLHTHNDALGAGERATKKMMDTRANELQLAKNSWNEFLTVVGDPILGEGSPVLKKITERLHEISDWEKESGDISFVFTTWISALSQATEIFPSILDSLAGVEGQAGKAGEGFINWIGDIETVKSMLYGTSVVIGGLVLSAALVHDTFMACLKPTTLLTGSLSQSLKIVKWILKGLDIIWGWDLSPAVAEIEKLEKATWEWTKHIWNAGYLSDNVLNAITKTQQGIEGITGKTKESADEAKRLARLQEGLGKIDTSKVLGERSTIIWDTFEPDWLKKSAAFSEAKDLAEKWTLWEKGLAGQNALDVTLKASMVKDLDIKGIDPGSYTEKTNKAILENQKKMINIQEGYINHLKSSGGVNINVTSESAPAWLAGLTSELLKEIVVKAEGEGIKALVGL